MKNSYKGGLRLFVLSVLTALTVLPVMEASANAKRDAAITAARKKAKAILVYQKQIEDQHGKKSQGMRHAVAVGEVQKMVRRKFVKYGAGSVASDKTRLIAELLVKNNLSSKNSVRFIVKKMAEKKDYRSADEIRARVSKEVLRRNAAASQANTSVNTSWVRNMVTRSAPSGTSYADQLAANRASWNDFRRERDAAFAARRAVANQFVLDVQASTDRSASSYERILRADAEIAQRMRFPSITHHHEALAWSTPTDIPAYSSPGGGSSSYGSTQLTTMPARSYLLQANPPTLNKFASTVSVRRPSPPAAAGVSTSGDPVKNFVKWVSDGMSQATLKWMDSNVYDTVKFLDKLGRTAADPYYAPALSPHTQFITNMGI